MDQPKINLTMQRPAPATATTREANPIAKSRFLRAMEQERGAKDGRLPAANDNAGVPLHTLLAFTQSNLKPAASPTPTPPKFQEHAELTALLERACSAMYVGDGSANNHRVLLTLDPVLGGAAAEIVRNGAHLSIRLHARNEHAFRSMSSQREDLIKSLGGGGDHQVDVEIVRVEGTGDSQSSPGGR